MVPFWIISAGPLFCDPEILFSDYMPSKPDESLPNTPETAVAKIGITTTSIRPIAAAMRPYSIAVAPDSSLMNFFI